MLKLGFPRTLHLNSGTEFKSKLIEHLTQQLGIKKMYFPPPPSQWKIRISSHRFIKDCILKFSIDGTLEWDELLPYATAVFIWFPIEHSQESPHFLFFRYDMILTAKTQIFRLR